MKKEEITQKIEFKEKPSDGYELLNILHPTVKEWFFTRFKDFSLPQLYGVMEIHKRKNILISAPTGSTKTLTGFLSILNELIDSAEKGILKNKIYCVYVSPLKALNEDIKFNLVNPLHEMEQLAKKKFGIRVAVRTGDTTTAERQKMLREPPHILITTPESLAILLSSPKFRQNLMDVEWCIIDEIHALADNKRGVHLSLSLEFLEKLSSYMTRVGLSATISPLEEIAKFLVGSHRSCVVVDVQFIKQMDLQLLIPIPNLMESSHDVMHKELYNALDNLIQENRTTLIFTNTRSATERVVHHLKDKFPTNYAENIGAHHGSLSKKLRQELETRLRNGELKVVVSSTSLELGIDIGYIDLVICLSSPKSVARFLQRAGRAGHKMHETVKARLIVMDRDDLVECALILKAAIEKKIDRIHIPTNCLDVLAQQMDGFIIAEQTHIDDLFRLVRKSYCYMSLAKTEFMEVIDYLAGRYTSLEDRHVYAKIWYDPDTGMAGRKGKMGRVIYMTNIGTIPDESFVEVKVGDQSIGKIDEAFLERLHPGDIFVLGGQVYEFKFARGMTAQVNSSVSRPPTVPSWFSEMLPLSFDTALEICKFRRLMNDKLDQKISKPDILKFIKDYLYVDEKSAEELYSYFNEQFLFSEIPHDKKIIIEIFPDDERIYYVFHTMFGRRVNDALSRAVAFAVSRVQHRDVDIGISDNGFFVSSEKKIKPREAFKMLKPAEFRKVLEIAIDKTEILKRRFRHCAGRALMILRSYKGHIKKVGRQQVSSQILINAVRRISDDFSILKEARREVLEDLMDVDSTIKVLEDIEMGKIKIKEISLTMPSPFALNLVSQAHTDTLRIEDKIEFLRRMHKMQLAKIGLKK